MEERKRERVLLLKALRGRELCDRVVEADRATAAAREPGGHVRRPAPELDDVATRDVGQHAQLGFGYRPDAPRGVALAPCALAGRRIVPGPDVPGAAIPTHVVDGIFAAHRPPKPPPAREVNAMRSGRWEEDRVLLAAIR